MRSMTVMRLRVQHHDLAARRGRSRTGSGRSAGGSCKCWHAPIGGCVERGPSKKAFCSGVRRPDGGIALQRARRTGRPGTSRFVRPAATVRVDRGRLLAADEGRDAQRREDERRRVGVRRPGDQVLRAGADDAAELAGLRRASSCCRCRSRPRTIELLAVRRAQVAAAGLAAERRRAVVERAVERVARASCRRPSSGAARARAGR